MQCCNTVILIGPLAPDGVDVGWDDAGTPWARFMVAVTEADEAGQPQTECLPCECTGEVAVQVGRLPAGQRVLVEGRVDVPRHWPQWNMVTIAALVTPVLPPVVAATVGSSN
jgi:Single-strand binding protein family